MTIRWLWTPLMQLWHLNRTPGLCSIVTEVSNIRAGSFVRGWRNTIWSKVCPELRTVLTMVQWKASGASWSAKSTMEGDSRLGRIWFLLLRTTSATITPDESNGICIWWHQSSIIKNTIWRHKNTASCNAQLAVRNFLIFHCPLDG